MGYNIPSEYTKTPDLRGRTIQRIMTEGLFNMAYWEPRSHRSCATASCLAGNIVLAAADLGIDVTRPYRYGHGIGSRAQAIWEATYGHDEALMVASGFYGGFSTRELSRITPRETIAFLYRCWKEWQPRG